MQKDMDMAFGHIRMQLIRWLDNNYTNSLLCYIYVFIIIAKTILLLLWEHTTSLLTYIILEYLCGHRTLFDIINRT